MAEPRFPATDFGGAPASFDTVFIDTCLDTHLAMIVSSFDTVAVLKKKILDEHTLCFPKFGRIKIDGLKVKRRGLYYHLAESMLVSSAFAGVKKGWFVTVEASIVSKDEEIGPEEANLALLTMNNGLEEEGVNVDLDKEAQGMEVERFGTGKELSNIDAGSTLPEGATDVKEKRKKRKRSRKGADDLSCKDIDVSMHELGSKGGVEEIKVPETTVLKERSDVVIGDVQISDPNVAGVQTGEIIASAGESEAQVEHVEFAKDGSKGYVVNEQSNKPFQDNLDGLNVANKRHKTGQEIDNEASLRESRTNGMTCEPLALSQLPTIDEQQCVTATPECPIADNVEAADQLASRSSGKKKRKTKSSKKVDKETAGVTLDETSPGEEIHLKEAGINSVNIAEELPPSDAHIVQPSVVSLTEKDPDSLQEQQNNLFSQDINEFQELIIDEANRVETEQEVPETVSIKVQKEVVESISREVDPSADNGKALKKRKKPRKQKVLMSGTESIPSEADHVKDYYTTDIPSSEPNKVGKAENSILEAAEKGDVKAAAADSLRDSLLVTDKENDEVIKKVVESAHQTTKSEAVEENKEGKSRKKTKKHCSDGKNSVMLTPAEDKCTDEVIPALSTVNIHGTNSSRSPYDDANLDNPSLKGSLDRAEIGSLAEKVGGDAENAREVDGVNFSSYFIPREQNKKTADPSEVTRACTKDKEGKSRKKTKKHGSDGKNFVLPIQAEDKCTDVNIPAPSTANNHGTDSSRVPYDDASLEIKDSFDRAEIGSLAEKNGGDAENASKVDGVNISSYFISGEQNKNTADPSEVTGAWTKTKSKKKRKVQEGNLHDMSHKLPGSPTLKENREAQAKPQEKKAESSSGKADKRKPHCDEAQKSNAPIRPNGGKPKKSIEHHHSESLTNTTSHTKKAKKDQSQSQQTGVTGGRGSNANPGEVVSGMVLQEPVDASRSLFNKNPFGDDSNDSLESYQFPYPLNQSRASSQETFSDPSVSAVHSDGESDAVLDSEKRDEKGMKTPLSSGIPLDTILKSSKRYKKAKLDAESQPEDFVPLSPSI